VVAPLSAPLVASIEAFNCCALSVVNPPHLAEDAPLPAQRRSCLPDVRCRRWVEARAATREGATPSFRAGVDPGPTLRGRSPSKAEPSQLRYLSACCTRADSGRSDARGCGSARSRQGFAHCALGLIRFGGHVNYVGSAPRSFVSDLDHRRSTAVT